MSIHTYQYRYLAELENLIRLESLEEKRRFEDSLQKQSVQERIQSGICWYPLQIIEDGYGFGEYPFLEVAYPKFQGDKTYFSTGSPVVLFSQKEGLNSQTLKGIIQFVHQKRMKIQFSCDELPDWIHEGKIGVNLASDQESWKDVRRLLEDLDTKAEEPHAGWLKALSGEKIWPNWTPKGNVAFVPSLNPSQQEAHHAMTQEAPLLLLHGPPGTGKTTTLVKIIATLVAQGKKVLVTAPSNAAVDLLASKIHAEGVEVIRMGNLAKVDAQNMGLTLEGRMQQSPAFTQIKQLKKQSDEYRRMAQKYKRKFGREEQVQRQLLIKEAKKCMTEVRALEQYALEQTLARSAVVAATLIGTNKYNIRYLKFDVVVIDEAGQATQAATWVPVSKAKQVILAGDPLQLPPTVLSEEAQSKGFHISLLEKLLHLAPTYLLDTQYRMHASIMAFSSQYFYEGKLKAHESVAERKLIGDEEPAFIFYDTAGAGHEENLDIASASCYNAGEMGIVANLLEGLHSSLQESTVHVGLITPYRKQTHMLQDWIVENQKDYPKFQLEAETIDSFQGDEKDVIVISMVRSNAEGIIGFLSDIRRMNVALTRAKKKLIVVGDSATLSHHPFYEKWVEYAQISGAYRSVWEL